MIIIKVSGSLFLICVSHDIVLAIGIWFNSTHHKTENKCPLWAVVIKIERH